MFRLDLALQDVNIEKLGHALACRVVARRADVARVKRVRLRQGYGATVFALDLRTRAKTGPDWARTSDPALIKRML